MLAVMPDCVSDHRKVCPRGNAGVDTGFDVVGVAARVGDEIGARVAVGAVVALAAGGLVGAAAGAHALVKNSSSKINTTSMKFFRANIVFPLHEKSVSFTLVRCDRAFVRARL